MRDTYLMFYPDADRGPVMPIQDIWFQGVEISRFRSLSCDWAGGGIVSTPQDLIRFHKALRNGEIIREDLLVEMDSIRHKFRPGIHYGLGMMELRFGEFFFLLRGLPRLRGHIGVLATHMFYDPEADAHIVMNFGSTHAMVRSFKALIEIVGALRKLRR